MDTNKNITHVGPNGRGNNEQKAQADFAKMLMEAAAKKQAEIDAKKGGKK